jgi:hypothetical protein
MPIRDGCLRPIRRFVLASLTLMACAANHSASLSPAPNEVLSEVSRRSGISKTELERLTAKCDADQQTMYFCAFRDLVEVDMRLDRVAADHIRRYPECKDLIAARLRDLRQGRDAACATSAQEEFGSGSMAQTARATCASSATKPMIESIAALNRCAQ